MRLARVLGAIGRTFITAGVLILLFVAYQLWGTGLREAQAQNRLEDEFAEVLADADDARPPSTTTSSTATTSTTEDPEAATTTGVPETVPTVEPVPEGEPTARIVIPKIGVDKIVVEGVSLRDLKKGPGHYPETPLPGQEGNAAIAGHRTTYGAPFHRIDELEPGDEIRVETVQGEFRYLVSEQLIVAPTQVDVLEDKGDNRLTLTACHPKYSARQRIIVVAQLAPDVEALPRPTRPVGEDGRPAPTPASLDDIDGEGAPALPAILLGVLCAVIWLLAWLLGRVWRRWPAYALGMPFFLVALFFFFEEFSRLLPSSF
ncbi:MAG: class E sortase [Acidimicrobiia bacterium]